MRSRWTAMTVFACLCTGCRHEFRINPAYAAPAAMPMQTTVHTSPKIWNGPVVSPENCTGNGLAEVVVSRSFLQRLSSVVTLGLYDPVTISWRCGKDSYATVRPF